MGIHIFNRFDRFLSSIEMFLSPFNETATVKCESKLELSNCVHRKLHSAFQFVHCQVEQGVHTQTSPRTHMPVTVKHKIQRISIKLCEIINSITSLYNSDNNNNNNNNKNTFSLLHKNLQHHVEVSRREMAN